MSVTASVVGMAEMSWFSIVLARVGMPDLFGEGG